MMDKLIEYLRRSGRLNNVCFLLCATGLVISISLIIHFVESADEHEQVIAAPLSVVAAIALWQCLIFGSREFRFTRRLVSRITNEPEYEEEYYDDEDEGEEGEEGEEEEPPLRRLPVAQPDTNPVSNRITTGEGGLRLVEFTEDGFHYWKSFERYLETVVTHEVTSRTALVTRGRFNQTQHGEYTEILKSAGVLVGGRKGRNPDIAQWLLDLKRREGNERAIEVAWGCVNLDYQTDLKGSIRAVLKTRVYRGGPGQ